MTDFGKVLTIEPNDINIVASPSEKHEKFFTNWVGSYLYCTELQNPWQKTMQLLITFNEILVILI